ncbi:uncharacterized protein PFL1_00772 [Pseudozyma flocculosa PF-1]|uniref:uncharacterized protein n=1 Tax=Pseudozyma flocculosa PF-1 TaxID=1277687 RepID=UPI0004561544|nr:uncharacterized protein PFL1_00772 [Pseudozyma flocculosa PF-1]EPQ31437.1 hypothetical protein PFL1_00772 [Pseudozyma flocculosa PF-1]
MSSRSRLSCKPREWQDSLQPRDQHQRRNLAQAGSNIREASKDGPDERAASKTSIVPLHVALLPHRLNHVGAPVGPRRRSQGIRPPLSRSAAHRRRFLSTSSGPRHSRSTPTFPEVVERPSAVSSTHTGAGVIRPSPALDSVVAGEKEQRDGTFAGAGTRAGAAGLVFGGTHGRAGI